MTNIEELLKDAPKGMKLYSPLFGEVEFVKIDKQSDYPIDVTDCKGNGKSFTKFGVYFADHPDAECLLFPSKECRTWEGWKLPIEPKFKVGDWIAGIDDEGDMATEKIVSFSHNKVLLLDTDGCHTEYPKTKLNGFHLWSISDAKDGDVLVCYSEAKGSPIEQAGIFKQYVGRHGGCSNTFLAHTGIDWDGNVIINGYMGSTNILPATKEQRDLFFKRMQAVGYQWDADKKELRKIQPHYDIANFKPFDKVLIRVGNNSKWTCDFFSYYHNGCFHCVGTDDWSQCIPFNEDTKHLLGTTDMPSEEYINW